MSRPVSPAFARLYLALTTAQPRHLRAMEGCLVLVSPMGVGSMGYEDSGAPKERGMDERQPPAAEACS